MNLNNAQKTAILHTNGPMLVLAGPGSGKTTVILERVRHLIETRQAAPDQILVVTFSRAAAEEMQRRFYRHREAGQRQPHGVNFGTLHSVFLQILKDSADYRTCRIVRPSRKLELLKTLLLQSLPEVSEEALVRIINEISFVKNNLLTPDHFISANLPDDLFPKVYEAYQRELQAEGLIDFDDILLLCLQLLRENAAVRRHWQERFRYVLVDEFQDINPVQYRVLCLLTETSQNLFVVGDDDQSIYGFRGAQPQIMRQFIKDHKQAGKVLLDVNYRCGKAIVNKALRLISLNKNRMDKRIVAGRDRQGYVQLSRYSTQAEEFSAVTAKLLDLHKKGLPFSAMAVLFRNGFEAALLAQKLAQKNVPFRLREKVSDPFESPMAKDLFSFLQAASGSCRRSDFLRIMNKPSRFLSRNAVAARESGPTSCYLQTCRAYYKNNPQMLKRISEFKKLLQFLSGCTPFSAICYLRRQAGYEDCVRQYAANVQKAPEDCLRQLDFLEESAKPFSDLPQWLAFRKQYAAQMDEHEHTAAQGNNGVNLMTMHASKGLEFDTVFLPCLNQGILPGKKASAKDALEEERRLLYVAMTRAANRLYLSFSGKIRNKQALPSEFLDSL